VQPNAESMTSTLATNFFLAGLAFLAAALLVLMDEDGE
jgi:hypothetical protein